MRSSKLLLMLLTGFFLMVSPSASASRVPLYTFEGKFLAPNLGQNADEGASPKPLFLSGSVNATGSGTGLFGFTQTQNVLASNIAQIEIYEQNETGSEPNRSNPIPNRVANYTQATLSLPKNATFYYYTQNTSHTLEAHSDFSIALPLILPEDLGLSGLDLSPQPSLALLEGVQVALEMKPGGEGIFYVRDSTIPVMVTSAEHPDGKTYSGSSYYYRFLEFAHLEASTKTLLAPISGSFQFQFQPTTNPSLVQERFDPSLLQGATGDLFSQDSSSETQPPMEAQILEALQSASVILNGALFGQIPNEIHIHGTSIFLESFTLLRFESLTLARVPEDESLSYQGQGRFLLAGHQLYTEKTVVGSGFFFFPPLSLVLWVAAAAALIVSFTRKPFIAAQPAFAAAPIRWTALGFQLLLALIVFLLWDWETRAFVGTSLLSLLLAGEAGNGTLVASIGSAQLATLAFAYTFFGWPLRLVLTSFLKLVALKPARGFAKGLGNLATWGLGASYLPVYLNPILDALIDRLSQGV